MNLRRKIKKALLLKEFRELRTTDMDMFDVIEKVFPKVKNGLVDGLLVTDNIPDISSTASIPQNYKILDGVRVADISLFKNFSDRSEEVYELADEIRKERKIRPLIVVVEPMGPYVAKGKEYLSALNLLGKDKFPAFVVLNMNKIEEEGIGDIYLDQIF